MSDKTALRKRHLLKTDGTSLNDKILKDEHRLYYTNTDVDFQSTYKTADGSMEWKDPTTSAAVFAEILKCLDITGHETFMDCGCGLGHVLYLASKSFTKIYGVEIVEEAVTQCRKNITALLPNNTINIFAADMFTLCKDLFDSVDVFYVANPFGNMNEFSKLRNIIETSIERNNRDVYFIYYYPYFEADMAKSNKFTIYRVLSSDNGNVNIYKHVCIKK